MTAEYRDLLPVIVETTDADLQYANLCSAEFPSDDRRFADLKYWDFKYMGSEYMDLQDS